MTYVIVGIVSACFFGAAYDWCYRGWQRIHTPAGRFSRGIEALGRARGCDTWAGPIHPTYPYDQAAEDGE